MLPDSERVFAGIDAFKAACIVVRGAGRTNRRAPRRHEPDQRNQEHGDDVCIQFLSAYHSNVRTCSFDVNLKTNQQFSERCVERQGVKRFEQSNEDTFAL